MTVAEAKIEIERLSELIHQYNYSYYVETSSKISDFEFDQKMPGFLTNDAVVHAPESRTSSPVLIPRDPTSFNHLDISNLYPIAEGAGYAGGIVSAAIDGLNCLQKIALEK